VEVPPGEIAVSIASPAPNTKTSEFGVDVTGTVSPVPDANHRKAQILVNGAFLTEATIDASGNFAARTALMETLVRDDVVIVGDPNVPVNTCGAKSAPIAVSLLRPQKPLNSIRVIVPLGDGQSAQASVGGIEHVLRVTSFSYTWAGNCGPGSKNESPGRVIAVGDAPVPVGTVDCGFNAPITCTGLVNLAIGTSVGQFTPVQTWNVAIQSCN
jgi:hypothetical protein